MDNIKNNLFFAFVSVVCSLVYYFNSLFALRNTTKLETGKHYLLVIAHPDDECMFFSPTICGLLSAGNRVSVLCLSSGNADGLGEVRQKELQASCVALGCKAGDVQLREHDKLQDSMTISWDPTVIARELALSIKSKKAQYDALLTFDEFGVSGHPNHTSLLPGLRAYLLQLPKSQTKPTLWKLHTTSLPRKYSGLLDALPSLTMVTYRVATSSGRRAKRKENLMAFMSDPRQAWRGQRAMVLGHKSQMRWFRWFWVIIGRYMYINDLEKVHL